MTKGLSLFAKRRRRNRTALKARAGTRPRLSVHRSGKHIYAQVIDDVAGKTVASASTLEKDVRGTSGANIAAATAVGTRVAEAAKAAGVQHIVWSTLEDTRQWMPAADTRMPMLQEVYRVPHFDAKAEADAFFAGLPVTFLRTSFYWDNLYMFGLAPKKGDDGQYAWAFPLGNAKMAGIGAEDIGRCAYGVIKGGAQYIGKTVGITGENLTVDEMGAKLSAGLGIGPVKYNAVDANVYRSWGFPGADEMGNMFQVYRDFEGPFLANRSAATAKALNPQLMDFSAWIQANKSKIPV